MELKYIVDGEYEFKLNFDKDQDWISIGEDNFHCLKDGVKVEARLIGFNSMEKTMEIRIEGHNYFVQIQDSLDQTIDAMGLKDISSGKIANVHAPMPGMVLDVLVKNGQTVEPGTELLILEAMKMENVIQADGSGVVSDIVISKGAAVDKGQLLIEME